MFMTLRFAASSRNGLQTKIYVTVKGNNGIAGASYFLCQSILKEVLKYSGEENPDEHKSMWMQLLSGFDSYSMQIEIHNYTLTIFKHSQVLQKWLRIMLSKKQKHFYWQYFNYVLEKGLNPGLQKAVK